LKNLQYFSKPGVRLLEYQLVKLNPASLGAEWSQFKSMCRKNISWFTKPIHIIPLYHQKNGPVMMTAPSTRESVLQIIVASE
jgi:hypothetical protein